MAAPRIAYYPDDWGKYPRLINDDGTGAEGPRSIRIIIDATAEMQEVDIRALLSEEVLSIVQSVKIDNSENTSPVNLVTRLTGDKVIVPGECMAILPLQFTINDNAFSLWLDAGVGVVTVWLYNTPKPAAVWYTQGAGNVVAISNTVTVTPSPSATGTRSSVAGAAADTSLLAANAARKGGAIFNDSTAVLYLALGAAAASTTSYTTQVAPYALYELPENFTGAVRGIWSAATGNARITELS